MKRPFFIAVIITGCHPTFYGVWNVVDTAGVVTEAYRTEIAVAADVIRLQEGVDLEDWGGDVVVFPEPFPCIGGTHLCAGFMNPHEVKVAYAPALGLGPAPGSTALEHELCHAAREAKTCGGQSSCDTGGEDWANACAASALPEIRRRMESL